MGDLVYLHTDLNKSQARNRYLVTSVDGIWCNFQKFIGSQLRNASYRIKKTECYKVPSHPEPALYQQQSCHDTYGSDDDDPVDKKSQPPIPPHIPSELSTPASNAIDPDNSINPVNNSAVTPLEVPETSRSSPPVDVKSSSTPTADTASPTATGPRRSERHHRPPSRLQDYVVDY